MHQLINITSAAKNAILLNYLDDKSVTFNVVVVNISASHFYTKSILLVSSGLPHAMLATTEK